MEILIAVQKYLLVPAIYVFVGNVCSLYLCL